MAEHRCGTCKHGKRIDLKMLECYGVPPTPVPMQRQQGLGGIQVTIQMTRPRMAVNDFGCSLWAFNLDTIKPAETKEEKTDG